MLHDPKFWLAISFLIFVAAMLKFAVPLIMKIIDDKVAKTSSDINSAAELKNKAEQLLAEAEKYYQDSIAHSQKLIADAGIEAANLLANSQKIIEEELTRKMELTTRRIRQEEERAMREIKSWLIASAINAIRDNVAKVSDKKSSELVLNKAIIDVSKLIH